MSSFHQQAVKNVGRIRSSKILPHQSVDNTKYLPIIQLWYDIDIDKEAPDSKKCIILPPDSWGGITQEKDLNHR